MSNPSEAGSQPRYNRSGRNRDLTTIGQAYNAIRRKSRRLKIETRDLDFGRTDKRSALTWHHVTVDALLYAALLQRRGNISLARVTLAEAKNYRCLAAGALSNI